MSEFVLIINRSTMVSYQKMRFPKKPFNFQKGTADHLYMVLVTIYGIHTIQLQWLDHLLPRPKEAFATATRVNAWHMLV